MNKTLTILVCIMVAGVVVGASLPIFDSLTASSESVHNEGAGWVRFALDRNADTTYSLSYTEDGNGFYIDNGTDRQTYDDSSTSNFETILYADSNLSVWYDDAIRILGTNEGNPVYIEGSSALTIVRDAEGVTVTPDGSDPVSFGVPTWSYIPVSTGNYGFFLAADFDSELGNGVKNYPSDMPLAVVGGGFAGVYAYNDIYRYNGLGLNMHPVYDEGGLFYGAGWDKTAPVESQSLNPDVLDPAVVDLSPIDIDLDPLDPGAQLMAVPTPTYTDGDWGYDIIQVDGVDKAVIVSWSGTSAGGTTLSIPGTVGGYDVYRLGKVASTSSSSAEVFSNNSFASGTITSISLPNGLVEIGAGAFSNNPRIGGDLVIPDSVTGIGSSAFRNTRFTTITIGSGVSYFGTNLTPFYDLPSATEYIVDPNNTVYASYGKMIYTKDYSQLCYCPEAIDVLTFHPSVTTIGKQAFSYCQNSGSLTIPNTITTIEQQAFESSHFSGEIVIPDSVTSLGQNAFTSMQHGSNLTLKIGTGISTIPYRAFYGSYFTGSLIIPSNVETIEGYAFASTRFDTIVIPNTVSTFGGGSFTGNTFKGDSSLVTLVYASDSALHDSDFQNCNNCQYVLDLSDTEDFTQNRRGLPATITVSDSIGECFGFVSVVDVSGSGGGPTQTLIGMLPLIMVLGLVLMAVGIFIWNRM